MRFLTPIVLHYLLRFFLIKKVFTKIKASNWSKDEIIVLGNIVLTFRNNGFYRADRYAGILAHV